MTDFSKYYTNNEKANSNFKETFTVETLKLSQGGEDFNVLPCKEKPGKCFFACGLIRGAVSQNLTKKINEDQPYGTLVVSHVVNDGSDPKFPNKFDGLLLHEKGENKNALLTI